MQLSVSQMARIRDVLIDPVKFARQCLMSDTWHLQNEILKSVNQPHSRTAVRACHASGKTFDAAAATLHFLARWDEAIVITTAPTSNQVESILWPEIWTACARSWYPWPKPLNTELSIGPKRYAMGFTTSVTKRDEGVKFQGFHAKHVLVIMDEAPGIDPKIYEAAEGIRSGGDVRLLCLGNPTITGGDFFDVFDKQLFGWNRFTISAFDTPNFMGVSLSYKDMDGRTITHGEGKDLLDLSADELNDNVRPYLISRRWVRERYEEWGPAHPMFEARVLGVFPTQSEVSLIPLTWLERCAAIVDDGEGELFAGIDVAGPGEAETVLCIRRGKKILKIKAFAQHDPRGPVVAELNPYKAAKIKVRVDSIGIGYNFALHLRDEGFEVALVNVQENAPPPATPDSIQFWDQKAQHYWHLREIIKNGTFCGLDDDRTKSQLTAIRYFHGPGGEVRIESKGDMRKRGIPSPDRAEAIMLAYAEVKISNAGVFEWYRDQSESKKNKAA